MGIISIPELSANVSSTLARVEAGETIEITRNGKVIAEMAPKMSLRQHDAEWQKARDELFEILGKGVSLGGPSTYDERTGRS